MNWVSRSGFDDLYYLPGMSGFEESKRHFQEMSTEVTLQKLSLNNNPDCTLRKDYVPRAL